MDADTNELMAAGSLRLGQGISVLSTGEEVAREVVCSPTREERPEHSLSQWDWQYDEAQSLEHEMSLLATTYRFVGSAIVASGDRNETLRRLEARSTRGRSLYARYYREREMLISSNFDLTERATARLKAINDVDLGGPPEEQDARRFAMIDAVFGTRFVTKIYEGFCWNVHFRMNSLDRNLTQQTSARLQASAGLFGIGFSADSTETAEFSSKVVSAVTSFRASAIGGEIKEALLDDAGNPIRASNALADITTMAGLSRFIAMVRERRLVVTLAPLRYETQPLLGKVPVEFQNVLRALGLYRSSPPVILVPGGSFIPTRSSDNANGDGGLLRSVPKGRTTAEYAIWAGDGGTYDVYVEGAAQDGRSLTVTTGTLAGGGVRIATADFSTYIRVHAGSTVLGPGTSTLRLDSGDHMPHIRGVLLYRIA